MNTWFTIETIDSTTIAISEYGHWERVHSYLVVGSESAVLIDTGLGIGNIKEIVDELTNLPVKVITTHVHWDHIGGHKYFKDIYVHKEDSKWLREGLPIPLEAVKSNLLKEPFLHEPPKGFNIDEYNIFTGEPSLELMDKDIIDLGDRKLQVLHTPGHSPGHICIYEKERGYIFTGDLVYEGVLYAFYPSTDPVKFKESIDRLRRLETIQAVLPGHNDLNVRKEIVDDIGKAFEWIDRKGLLKHGTGIHKFIDFSIHL